MLPNLKRIICSATYETQSYPGRSWCAPLSIRVRILNHEQYIPFSILREIKFSMTWWKVFKLISIRSDSINIDTKTYFHIKSDFIFSIESQFQSNFNPGPSVPKTYLWSTTIVPPSKKLEKTNGKPVPLEYHYSTSISKLTPIRKLREIITILISSKCYQSQN